MQPADAELDDAAYDANMRSAVSGSLSESADRLSSSSGTSVIGDASDSDDADSDANGAAQRKDAGIAACTNAVTPSEGNIAAQRTRSWDDSVEEGMAKIDAETPSGGNADKQCALQPLPARSNCRSKYKHLSLSCC